MELIVFCHENIGYLVPNNVVELAKLSAELLESEDPLDIDAANFIIDSIKSKYKPIKVGYMFTQSDV